MGRIVMVVALAVLVLGGCGIPKQNDRETAKPTTGGVQTVGVDATNDAFRPKIIQAQPGRPVVVEVHNKGWTKHTFTIDGTGVDVLVQPGQTKRVTVNPPGGEAILRFYCHFHDGDGMHGKLVFGTPSSTVP